MSDIIERLEKATGPDRNLDAAIMQFEVNRGAGQHIELANESKDLALSYTSSIDAALTLAPDGWAWFVEWIGPPFSEGQARLWIPAQRTQSLRRENITCAAKTPAIAFCICALKARAEVENAPS